MENNEQLLKYDENIGLYDHINPVLNLKDLNRKQVKELAKEIANNESQTHSWQEVLNDAINYDSKNKRQEKRFKRIFNKQLNENLAPILEKQHKQELIDRMKSGDASAMSQWTTEGINKFGHQFMPVMLTAATLPFGIGAFGQAANTIGLLPALGAEAGSWGLGYGGYKLGSKLDDDFGTNWIAPALSVASGIGGYGTGYKGMVKLGSRGWLPKGDKFMYGSQFIGDVATDAFKKNVKTFNIDTAVDSARKLETMQKLRNSGQTLDPYYQVGVDQNIVPDDLPEYILPLSQLKQDYPKAQLVPLGKQTNVWSLDGNLLVSGKNVGYDHPLRGTQHRVLKIGNKQYYVGTDPVKNQGSNILIHQGDLPMSDSKVVPIEGNTGITKIWWEQNTPFYGKIDHPKAKVGTYIIDDVIPTEYALERSGIFGSKHSVLSGEVDLADPKTNFRFFTYDPISGEIVQSPFVFPKNNSTQGNISYKFFERPSKLTFEERMGIPKGERNQPAKSPTKNPNWRDSDVIELPDGTKKVVSSEYPEDVTSIQQSLKTKQIPSEIAPSHESLISWYQSPQYKERLINAGFSEEQANIKITELIQRLSPENITYVAGVHTPRSLKMNQYGDLAGISPSRHNTFAAMYSGHPDFPDRGIIQITKSADIPETVFHEGGGHHTESLLSDYSNLYSGQTLTETGEKASISKGLPGYYYPSWNEARARAMTIASQMRIAGWNPNSPEQVNVWLNKHLLKDHNTNVVQGALYYDRPGFVKAVTTGLKQGGKIENGK